MRVLKALDGDLVRFSLVKRGGKLIRGEGWIGVQSSNLSHMGDFGEAPLPLAHCIGAIFACSVALLIMTLVVLYGVIACLAKCCRKKYHS